MATFDSADPAHVLGEVQRLREQARRQVHAGAWMPVATLAALLLASIVLYARPFGPFGELWPGGGPAPYWAGLPDAQRSPLLSYALWLVGTPLTFAAIGAWYRRQARRTGMQVAWKWFAITGAAAFVLLVLLAAVPDSTSTFGGEPMLQDPEPVSLPSALTGLATPLLPIAVALVALGWVERSRALALSAAWIAVVAWWQCSQGMGRLAGWAVWILDGFQGPALGGELTLLGLNRPGPTLIAMTLPLLVFVAVRLVRNWLGRVRRVPGGSM